MLVTPGRKEDANGSINLEELRDGFMGSDFPHSRARLQRSTQLRCREDTSVGAKSTPTRTTLEALIMSRTDLPQRQSPPCPSY